MNTLFAILKLLPLVLTAVKAVEEAIPLPGQGKKKLDLVLDILRSAYDGGMDVAKEFSWEKLVTIGEFTVQEIARGTRRAARAKTGEEGRSRTRRDGRTIPAPH